MISIVVCSVKPDQFNQFSESIGSTIGVPFEIIRIDNSRREYNLCQAYNEGKAKCRYDIICFSHEDILFRTQNWGNVLIDLLKDQQIGLVGVMGICFFSLFPQGWYDQNELEGQVVVGALEGSPARYHTRFPSTSIAEVAGIDGIFMATRKDVIEKFRFSEDILKGFHGYDIDINMQIRQQYRIVITRDLLLYHHSGGVKNADYYESMCILAKKWKDQLPIYVSGYTKKEVTELKIRSLREYYQQVVKKDGNLTNYLVAIRYALRQKVFFSWLNQNVFVRAQ